MTLDGQSSHPPPQANKQAAARYNQASGNSPTSSTGKASCNGFPKARTLHGALNSAYSCSPPPLKKPTAREMQQALSNVTLYSYKKLPITNGDELGSLSLLPLSISKIVHIFGTTCVFINYDRSIIPRCERRCGGKGFSRKPHGSIIPRCGSLPCHQWIRY